MYKPDQGIFLQAIKVIFVYVNYQVLIISLRGIMRLLYHLLNFCFLQFAWLTVSQLGAHYMWGPRSPRVQNYIKCDPNASGSGPFFYFSRNSSLNPRVQEITSCSGTVEEKQFLPNALETEVSCSLTLGLDTENKLKTPAAKTSDDKIASMVASSKESDVAKVPPSVKAAAKARRKRWEIIKLKQMYRKE